MNPRDFETGLAFFLGYFGAMCVVNAIASWVLRSIASVFYATLMASMVGIEIFFISGHAGGPLLHATLIALYLTSVVAFALSLLRSWKYDRVLAFMVAGLLLFNYPLVYCEILLGNRWPYYAVDQGALDALVIALIVLGVRAFVHEGWRVAGSYLVGYVGAAAGSVLNDLATNHILPHTPALIFSFDAGVAWEAAFFALAVAMHNRTIVRERDVFARLALVDGLTGVANRRTFDDELERMWATARRAHVPLAVLMVDIDDFKMYNDERGHLAGDDCLRRVARACATIVRRGSDCLARYGGEEFAAVLFDVDRAGAASLAERLRASVEAGGDVTVSVGVAARVPAAGDRVEMLVFEADAALYGAKETGRNRVTLGGTAGASTTDGPGSARPTDLRSETP